MKLGPVSATLLALTASAALAAPALAQNVRERGENQSPVPARVADFAWLAGRWIGEGLGGKVEEVFSPPAGGAILGHFQLWNDAGPRFYELENFVEENGSVVLRVKHFGPTFKAWEDKEDFAAFPLLAVEGQRFYFSGLTFERIGEREMRQHLVIHGKDGTAREEVLTYRRAD